MHKRNQDTRTKKIKHNFIMCAAFLCTVILISALHPLYICAAGENMTADEESERQKADSQLLAEYEDYLARLNALREGGRLRTTGFT